MGKFWRNYKKCGLLKSFFSRRGAKAQRGFNFSMIFKKIYLCCLKKVA